MAEYLRPEEPAKPKSNQVFLGLALMFFFFVGFAILWPMGGSTREDAKKAACLSNMKQWGTSILIYAEDFDDHLPLESASESGAGWAGRLSAYSPKGGGSISLCPTEFTDSGGTEKVGDFSRMSYAMNRNLRPFTLPKIENPKMTVMLFEVNGARAKIGIPDEGVGLKGECWPVSPVGAGVVGDLVDSVGKCSPTRVSAVYATGRFEGSATGRTADAMPGRHKDYACYLLADLHAVSRKPKDVWVGPIGKVDQNETPQVTFGAK
jgi:hypothetical protein